MNFKGTNSLANLGKDVLRISKAYENFLREIEKAGVGVKFNIPPRPADFIGRFIIPRDGVEFHTR